MAAVLETVWTELLFALKLLDTSLSESFLFCKRNKCHWSARYASLSFRQVSAASYVSVSIILALLWRCLCFWILEVNSTTFVKLVSFLNPKKNRDVYREVSIDFLLSKNKKVHLRKKTSSFGVQKDMQILIWLRRYWKECEYHDNSFVCKFKMCLETMRSLTYRVYKITT